MPTFDSRSFIITSAAVGILCALVFFVLRRSFPKEIGGLTNWAWGCIAMIAGAFLFTSRDLLSPLFSITFANTFVIAGIALMYISVRRFAGLATDNRKWFFALVVTFAALLWLTVVSNNYRGRVVLVTAINMTLFMACALVIVRIKGQGFPERFTAAIFAVTAFVSFARFFTAVTGYDTSDYLFDNSLMQQVYLGTFSIALISLSIGFLLMVTKKLQTQLEYVASHDDLTGVFTRATFFDLLAKEIGRANRHLQSVSLLIIDIDDFKLVNDCHGHPVGDQVIKGFANLVVHELRKHDVFCRYGGEEFAILLPNTDSDEAYAVAERIRARFADFEMEGIASSTVSIGVMTSFEGSTTVMELIDFADKALYTAKNTGKNRVVRASEIRQDSRIEPAVEVQSAVWS